MLSLAIAVSTVWLSNVARDHLLAERDAVLSTAAESLAADLDKALRPSLQSLASMNAEEPAPGRAVAALKATHPEFEWVAWVDAAGRLVAQTEKPAPPPAADTGRWFERCPQGPWLGAVPQPSARPSALVLCTPLVDPQGRVLGVGAAKLPERWLATVAEAAWNRLKLDSQARALVIDPDQHVLVDHPPRLPASSPGEGSTSLLWTPGPLVLQRVDEGRRQVVVRAQPAEGSALRALGVQVLLMRPGETSLWEGGRVQQDIAWMSLGLSVVAALIGILLARRLTRRLTDLTAVVKRVGTDPWERIEPPPGRDEVSELGRAFRALLDSLRREHGALNALTVELEQRVQARTREVERLAADSRYAAVVRERLRLARDLHDTLAQSMMAMLAEIRMLRRLHTHDPSALAAELERAEQVAHDGLGAARAAIGEMRLNAVRDLGLGPALASALGRFADRTGLDVAYRSDEQAATFADDRAEVLFRIAEEALRNIVRHAGAAHVEVTLRAPEDGMIELTIRDDGVGFDPREAHPGHYGVVGMHEQAQLIDADLELDSQAGRGTTVRLRLRAGPDLQS